MAIEGMTIQVNDNDPIELDSIEEMTSNAEFREQAGEAIRGLLPGARRSRRTGSEFTLNGTEKSDRYVPPQVMGDYIKALDVAEIGKAVIAEYTGYFEHLEEARIQYLWKAKGGTSGGKAVLGKCQKPSGLLNFYSGSDFIVWLAADNVRDAHLTNHQVEALVFHELLHASYDDEKTQEAGEYIYCIKGHDFEGFFGELEQYGAWDNDLRNAQDRFKQRGLFDQDGGTA